jgi:hypothetical protein
VREALIHGAYGVRQLSRQPAAWPKTLVFVPLSEVLPFLLLGTAFLARVDLVGFFYANLVWFFVASVVVQCLVWFQIVTTPARFDIVLMARGGLLSWVFGFALGVAAFYGLSAAIACGILAFVLGYPLQASGLLAALLLATPTALALVALTLGLELRFGRVFHLVNLALDGLQVVSCVLYPLSLILAVLRPVAVLSPLTWLNEYLRRSSGWALLAAAAISAVMIAGSTWWIQASVRRLRQHGTAGGAL